MGLFDKIKDLVAKDKEDTRLEPAQQARDSGEYSPEDLDHPPEFSFVLAMHAAARGDTALIQRYLQFNPHYALCKDWDENTLLHKAALFAQAEVVDLLLQHGAKVNALYQEKTPLHLAIGTDPMWVKTNKPRQEFAQHRQRQQATLKLLLAAQADPSLMDDKGETPLHTAARMGYADLAKLLLVEGVGVDVLTGSGEGQGGHTEGRTPLLLVARHSKNLRMMQFLLEQGANPNLSDNEPGYTPLHYIAAAPHYDDPERERLLGALAELLLQHKADPDLRAPLKNNQTPLHLAASNDHLQVADVLIRHGADMLAQNSKRLAPMALAATAGSLEMMRCLLDHGVDVYKSRAMFHAAYCRASTAPMQLLIERGVDINHPDEHGVTAIFAAIAANSFANVKFLLDHGADTKLHPAGLTVTQHAFANWGAVEAMPEEKRQQHVNDARSIIEVLGGFAR